MEHSVQDQTQDSSTTTSDRIYNTVGMILDCPYGTRLRHHCDGAECHIEKDFRCLEFMQMVCDNASRLGS
jgi:hypothetical protein